MPEEDVVEEVAERLVRFRARRGLTVEDAAGATGIDVERLADAEAGTVGLGEVELERVCAAYGVALSEVFGGRITPIQDYAGTG
jgi:transcriptional regulator with XRE-family HTH domain